MKQWGVRATLGMALAALLLLPACQARLPQPPRPLVLVSDLQGGGLVSLEPSSARPLGMVPMPGSPQGMAVARGLVVVALLGRPYLEVLSLPGLEEVRRIYVGQGCSDVAVDPEGRLLAAAVPSAGEVVLTPLAGGELRRVSVGGQPTGLAWSGRRLFVSNLGNGSLQWIDQDGSRLQGEVPVGLGPRGIAVAGDRVLVALYDANQVAVVPAAGDPEASQVRHLALAGGPFDLVPTGGGALVSLSDTGQVAAVDLQTGESTTVAVGAGAAGLAVSSDGQFLYCCCESAGQVAVLALHDNQVVDRARMPAGVRPREAVFIGSSVFPSVP